MCARPGAGYDTDMQPLYFALLAIGLLPTGWSQQTVTLDYTGVQTIQACAADTVVVNWKGYHNIQETSTVSCDPGQEVGLPVSPYQSSGHTQTFSGGELAAAPGQVRHFKCTLHCSAVHFSVSCSTPLADTVCIDSSLRVAQHSGGFVALADVVPGMVLRAAKGHPTTVRRVTRDHSTDAPFVVQAGTCGSRNATTLSPAHAVLCRGKWVQASEIAHRHPLVHPVSYTNVQTDDYCNDELVLETGLVVETWDGRARNQWRPHSYSGGDRHNCAPLQ